MALNNTVRVTLSKPTADELPRADPRCLHPGPGNNWNDPAFAKDHCKKQLLSQASAGVVKKYSPHYTQHEDVPELKTQSATELLKSLTLSHQGKSAELTNTTHLTLEDKVLRFFAFFTEAVRESAVETSRTRKVSITYFPADDTVLIQEPRIANTGIDGGTLLKRQRVPAVSGELLTINDFNVGCDVTIHNRRYHIYDCDARTRIFMEELGIEVGNPEREPVDEYVTEYRRRKIDGGKTLGQKLSNDNRIADDHLRTRRFIEDSGKVLRFFGYWDDRETPGSHIYKFDIRYFIEDDTIAVFEQVPGSGANPTFMSKRRLPKDGVMSKGADLTFAGRVNGMKEPYIGTGEKYYTASDIRIGGTLNVFGRVVHICDCDPWTREYFRDELGVQLGEPIDMSFLEPAKKTYTTNVPPPTGFGTHEDSLASTKSLVLKPPKTKDKGTTGDVLRYEMKLHEPERSEDSMRVFTLTFHLDDGEMMVTEMPIRNTGFTGGKFMKKQLMPKDPKAAKPEYITHRDIAVGKVMNFMGFKFIVTRADLHSEGILARLAGEDTGAPVSPSDVSHERLHYLLSQFQEFVTVRFCTLTEAFRNFDKDKDGKITFGELKAALKDNQVTTSEDEVVAVLQQLDVSDTGFISYQDLFTFMSNVVHIRKPSVDINGIALANDTAAYNAHKLLRNKVLKQLKERLETRCLNGFEMFRMISTMPRAFKGRRAELMSLTNGAKDSVFTPVQLRRAVQEPLGMSLTTAELAVLLDFFFPDLPTSMYNAPADVNFDHVVDVKTFQAKLVEMGEVDHLH